MAKNSRHHIKQNLFSLIIITVFYFACLCFTWPEASFAAESLAKYPVNSIKITVPAGAGGSLGQEIRLIKPFIEKNLGIPMSIDYVTGAGGLIAYNKFFQEKPDGSSIMQFNLLSPIALELTRGNAKYVTKNLSPIASWNVKNFVLVVHQDSWKTFDEFINDAKKRKISIASIGGGSDIQGHIMEKALKLNLNWIPYNSSAEAIAAAAGKHVDSVLTLSTSPIPMIRAGRLRGLAVFSSKPDRVLPGVPNLKELKYTEVPLLGIQGMFAAPPNTPREIVATLEKAVNSAVASPELDKLAETTGIVLDFRSSTDLKNLISEYYELLNKNKEFIK